MGTLNMGEANSSSPADSIRSPSQEQGAFELSRFTTGYVRGGEQPKSRIECLQFETIAHPFGTKLGMESCCDMTCRNSRR